MNDAVTKTAKAGYRVEQVLGTKPAQWNVPTPGTSAEGLRPRVVGPAHTEQHPHGTPPPLTAGPRTRQLR